MLTTQLTATLRHSMRLANQRRHQLATTEHLLLALLDDPQARAVLTGCGADLAQLRRRLNDLIDHQLQPPAVAGTTDCKPTSAYQRVMQKAAHHALAQGLEEVNGADVLAAMFLEADADAVRLLDRAGVSQAAVVGGLERARGVPD